MSDATFASLGATLLARKGGAKPAMRPQWGELTGSVADAQLEDLGWNDMGTENTGTENTGTDKESNAVALKSVGPKIVSIDPSGDLAGSPSAKRQAANEDADELDAAPELLINAQREPKKSASKAQRIKAKRAKSAPKSENSPRRAAFTLRLDADRHLKLRLAATMQGVSAQVLMTEALDSMLSEIEGLDTLIQCMATRKNRH